MISIPETLRSNGLKVTPQRIAILNTLMNTKSHPTAEAIFKSLEPTNPTMSLATVYKTLDSFTSAGIIQQLTIDGDSLHYDFETDFHPHLICMKCNKVCDVNVDISDEFKTIIDKISSDTNFKVSNEQLFFYGLCEECSGKDR
ncbi:peroxide operon regulator [Clostridiales bacterium]|nr:peroxide operon regulator [Clostridiales bacterium]